MAVGFGQLFIILVIILLLFGAGKLPQVMSDIGKGLKAFRNSVDDDKYTRDE